MKRKLTGFSICYWIFFTKCNFWHFSTGINHIFQERWINKKRGHVKIFALCHSHCWLCSKSFFLLFVVCYLGYMRLLEEMLLQWHALVFFRSTVDIDKDLFTTMTFHIKSRLLVRIGGNSSSWHTCYFLWQKPLIKTLLFWCWRSFRKKAQNAVTKQYNVHIFSEFYIPRGSCY